MDASAHGCVSAAVYRHSAERGPPTGEQRNDGNNISEVGTQARTHTQTPNAHTHTHIHRYKQEYAHTHTNEYNINTHVCT